MTRRPHRGDGFMQVLLALSLGFIALVVLRAL
jgi:hypothetical protein